MIIIARAQTNDVVVTLNERKSLASPYYLFELESGDTQDKFYFIASDISAYPERYNHFEITEKANPNALAGEVNLTYPGQYKYTIYEQTSSTNLNPALATGEVESGICHVPRNDSDDTEFDTTLTTTAFDGGE